MPSRQSPERLHTVESIGQSAETLAAADVQKLECLEVAKSGRQRDEIHAADHFQGHKGAEITDAVRQAPHVASRHVDVRERRQLTERVGQHVEAS